MKITINSIYEDNHNLFKNNSLIIGDNRMSDIALLSDDLDLIVEMTYGDREIYKRFLTADDDECYVYNLSKIQKSVYATLVENLLKYNTLLECDEEFADANPLHQFFKHSDIGERERQNDFASRVDTTTHGNVNNTRTFGDIGETTVHGNINNTRTFGDLGETTVHGTINNTNTYGQVTEQNVVGQAINTMQNGARETTNGVTSFSSDTFKNTEKQTNALTTDTQTMGSHTDTLTTSHATPDTSQTTQGNDTVTTTHGNDTEQITQGNDTVTTTHGNDTEQITRGNDSITHGAHLDTITDTASEDEVYGYNNLSQALNERREYVKRNLLNEITRDVVNGISYGVYTF